MASRKDKKEQARAARLAQEQADAAHKQRTRRLQIVGGTVAVAVVVIAVIVATSLGGGSSSAKSTPTGLATGTKAHQLYRSVSAELAGIPQHGSTLGDPSAKVTMQYFGDLECPICRDFTLTVLPQFIRTQVRTGKAKVQYRTICTATCDGKMSTQAEMATFNRQQIAAFAAGKQHKFWQYAELFYHQQQTEGTGYVTEAWLNGIARQIKGFDLASWRTARKDQAYHKQLAADSAFAEQKALPGTPALIMQGPKGEEIVDNSKFPVYGDLVKAVKALS